MTRPLASAFASGSGGRAQESEALEARLEGLWQEGRRAWPEVALEGGAFVGHLAERVPPGAEPLEAIERLHAADLYLACACARGDPAAVQVFEKRFLSRTAAYVVRFGLGHAEIDEVQQAVGEKLLLGRDDRPAKIAEYAGTGTLESWVRVAVLRTALNLKRGERRREAAHERGSPPVPTPDPELELMKHRHRRDFEEAFRLAVASLPARDRVLLRLHFLDGLSAREAGRLYAVHKSTAARWLADAQQAVFEETRRLLRERLGLSATECESLMGLVLSRVDVTLHSLLKKTIG